jgi:hypothetical protein
VVGNPELTCLCFGLCQIVNALIEFRTSSTLPPCARVTAHPSITGWKTAPRASGADDAASVLFRHEVAGLIVLRSFGEKTHPNVLMHYSDVWCSDPSFGCTTASLP